MSEGNINAHTDPLEGPGTVVNIPRQGPTGVFELQVVPIKERLQPPRLAV